MITYRNETNLIEGEGNAALTIMEENCNKGDRPSGTTKKRKRTISLAMIAAKNEITSIYANSMKSCEKLVKKNNLTNIIRNVKARNNIPADIKIKYSTILQRILRSSIFYEGI